MLLKRHVKNILILKEGKKIRISKVRINSNRKRKRKATQNDYVSSLIDASALHTRYFLIILMKKMIFYSCRASSVPALITQFQ